MKYDILHFYRDNLIANSGTRGIFCDISLIPTFLGSDITERFQKYLSYRKSVGVALIDTSQEGRSFNDNTTLQEYDDSLKYDVIQAFDMAIQSIENTCCSITGVSREYLVNGIEQKDAVTNVEVGVKMSAIVTKSYTQVLDSIINEVLTDSLNTAKKVFKKGIKGVLILGETLQKVFTALPKYYTLTDFDVHVNNSSELLKDMDTIKQLVNMLVSNNLVDAETAVEAVDSKSMTDLKRSVKSSVKKQKEEMGQVSQLTQQVNQLTQQLQELQKQMQQAQQQVQQVDQQKMQFESQQAEADRQIEWYKAKVDKKYKEDTIKEKERLIQAEVAQLYDGNKKNDEIKNI